MEDPNSEETKLFIDAQNALTKPYLASCKSRQDIHDRLKQLWDFPKYMCPWIASLEYFLIQILFLRMARLQYHLADLAKMVVFLHTDCPVVAQIGTRYILSMRILV